MHSYAGGMVGGAIPEYRLPASVMQRDLATLENLGVRIHYNTAAGRDVHVDLRQARVFRVGVKCARLRRRSGRGGSSAITRAI